MKPPLPPTRYRHKYADGVEVSSEDLQTAYRTAAKLVADHGDRYMPLFDRLNNEVQQRDQANCLKRRALEVASAARSSEPGPA